MHKLTVVSGLAVAVMWTAPAVALQMHVDSNADRVDALPGDGICATATPVKCTLRAAIQEANAWPGFDRIEAPPDSYRLSLGGAGEDGAASGDLDIHEALALVRVGAAGNGPAHVQIWLTGLDSHDRLIDVHAATPATVFEGVLLTFGAAVDDLGGSALLVRSGAEVLLADSIVYANFGRVPTGNAIAVYGHLSAERLIVSDNHDQNRMDARGTVYVGSGGMASFERCRVEGNTVGGAGGAVFVEGADSALIMRRCVVRENQAGQRGGAIALADGASAQLENVYIERNYAAEGGGAWLGTATQLRIAHGSLLGNIASDLATLTVTGASAKITVTNTLIGAVAADGMQACNGPAGIVVSLGATLLHANPGCVAPGPGDLIASDFGLLQGQDWLQPGATSVALDAAAPIHCPPVDLRGRSRPRGAGTTPRCDIGALEAASADELFATRFEVLLDDG